VSPNPTTPKLVSVNMACTLLGLSGNNPVTLFRLCLKGRIEHVLTEDDQIKIVTASITRYLEELGSQK